MAHNYARNCDPGTTTILGVWRRRGEAQEKEEEEEKQQEKEEEAIDETEWAGIKSTRIQTNSDHKKLGVAGH